MSDKRIYELTNTNTLSAGDKFAIDKSTFDEAKSVDASAILTPISDLQTEKAPKSDLANISVTGSTNNTGSTITSGTYFYKDGALAQAKADIAAGATLTLNTNYEIVTAGGLNALNAALNDKQDELHFEVWTVTVANTSTAGSAIGGYYGAAYISSSPQYNINKWTNKKVAIPLIGRKSGAYNFLTVIGIADGTIYTNSPVVDNIECSILVIY